MSEPAAADSFVAGRRTGEAWYLVVGEVVALWLGVNVIIRFVRMAWEATPGGPAVFGASARDLILGLVPILFLYAPVLVCRLRRVDSWAYPLAIPALSDPVWKRVLLLNLAVIGIVAVPFVIGYYGWHVYVLGDVVGSDLPVAWPTPGRVALLIGFHLFFVAIPEEFFYRGYLQTRLNEAFSGRVRILGAMVGPGLILATILFAFGHSIVYFQPWHAAIIFPGLVFAWMRARTDDAMAGAVFHAWCNVTVTLLDILAGLQPPDGM